jgi:pimeloyl-ACP methyl ester carboxylesterase
MWIYAASNRANAGANLPVVIFGHGQGPQTIANCDPDGKPTSPVVAPATDFVDTLGQQGYLGIAVFYRNTGDGAPRYDTSKLRDGYVFDARAFLAAARWGRDHHGAGSERVALIGSSFGTNAMFWAVANHPGVTDLQTGLHIATITFAGHTANGLVSRSFPAMTTSASADIRAGAFLLGAIGVAQATASADGAEALTAAGLATTSGRYLTAQGRALVTQVLVNAPDPAKTQCANLTEVAMCKPICLAATYEALVAPKTDPGQLTDWLSPDAAAATLYDPSGGDPGPTPSNPVLKLFRDQSPTLAATGPIVVKRALLLLSDQDDVIVDQTPQGPATLKAKLDSLSVPWTAPKINSDAVGTCEHDSYFEPQRNCGFAQLLDELRQAF